jgi:hypothetical protein
MDDSPAPGRPSVSARPCDSRSTGSAGRLISACRHARRPLGFLRSAGGQPVAGGDLWPARLSLSLSLPLSLSKQINWLPPPSARLDSIRLIRSTAAHCLGREPSETEISFHANDFSKFHKKKRTARRPIIDYLCSGSAALRCQLGGGRSYSACVFCAFNQARDCV